MAPEHPETFRGAILFIAVGLLLIVTLVVCTRRLSWATGATWKLALTFVLGTVSVCTLLVGLWLLLASYSPNWGR